jgi:hypothetical protein
VNGEMVSRLLVLGVRCWGFMVKRLQGYTVMS